jgi:[acyl-carrier-protein] S-malonyltransferase
MSGDSAAVDRAGDDVRDIGLRYSRLDVPGALHSPLMQAAADRLEESMASLSWSAPTIPVIPNVDAVPTRDPRRLFRLLREHLTSPVRWEATSRAFGDLHIDAVVECSGSSTLGPFIRQVNPFLPTYLLSDPRSPLPEFTEPDLSLPELPTAQLSPAELSETPNLTPLELSTPVPARPERALQAATASITPA